MKRTLLAAFALCVGFTSIAQDSTNTEKIDTIKVGGVTIIRKKGANNEDGKHRFRINDNEDKKANVKTNWGVLDIGFTNYTDNTNYGSAEAQAYTQYPTGGINSKDALKLRTGKSVNVNLWFFMQRVNLIKHVVNLKYGLGLELNNYHFADTRVNFEKDPSRVIIDPKLTDLKKNKLAADYLTLPAMINFNFTPDKKKAYGFSVGASVGYLYSSRQKFKHNGGGKEKEHDDFGLNKWKISYIAEISLGVVRFYGSYATKSMWEKGLDQTPYSFGIRLSSW